MHTAFGFKIILVCPKPVFLSTVVHVTVRTLENSLTLFSNSLILCTESMFLNPVGGAATEKISKLLFIEREEHLSFR